MRPTRSRAVPQPTPRRLFIFGLGYSALVLARRLKARGWNISGTSRTAEGCRVLAGEGITALPFDGRQKLADLDLLVRATHVLSSVPPDGERDPVIDCHGADLAALNGVKWVGYLSTTGVYGDRGGDWVSETAGLHPTGSRGRARV